MPTQEPSSLGPTLDRERFPTNFRLRQMPQEVTSFLTIGPRLRTPAPPDVFSQTGPTALGDVSPSVPWLSPKKPRPPSCSVAGGTPSRRRHHGGVDGQLGSMVQRQTISDNIQTSCIGAVLRQKVQVEEHHVCGHPGTRFPKRAPQLRGQNPGGPNLCAKFSVVATEVKWKATPAVVGGRGVKEARDDGAATPEKTETRSSPLGSLGNT